MTDCNNCEKPIVENGRNWIHTDDRFMCSGGDVTGGYAVPMEVRSMDAIDAAYEAGYHDALHDGG